MHGVSERADEDQRGPHEGMVAHPNAEIRAIFRGGKLSRPWVFRFVPDDCWLLVAKRK